MCYLGLHLFYAVVHATDDVHRLRVDYQFTLQPQGTFKIIQIIQADSLLAVALA